MSFFDQLNQLKNKVSGSAQNAYSAVQAVQQDNSWMGRAMRFAQSTSIQNVFRPTEEKRMVFRIEEPPKIPYIQQPKSTIETYMKPSPAEQLRGGVKRFFTGETKEEENIAKAKIYESPKKLNLLKQLSSGKITEDEYRSKIAPIEQQKKEYLVKTFGQTPEEVLKEQGKRMAKTIAFNIPFAGLVNVAKNIAKETTEVGIKKILGKNAVNYSDDVIKKLASTTDEKTVGKILSSEMKPILDKSKQVNPLIQETKYKQAEDLMRNNGIKDEKIQNSIQHIKNVLGEGNVDEMTRRKSIGYLSQENSNPSTRRAYELLTGDKLPKTQKGSIEFLQNKFGIKPASKDWATPGEVKNFFNDNKGKEVYLDKTKRDWMQGRKTQIINNTPVKIVEIDGNRVVYRRGNGEFSAHIDQIRDITDKNGNSLIGNITKYKEFDNFAGYSELSKSQPLQEGGSLIQEARKYKSADVGRYAENNADLLYHGTGEQSAKDILKNGFKTGAELNKGEKTSLISLGTKERAIGVGGRGEKATTQLPISIKGLNLLEVKAGEIYPNGLKKYTAIMNDGGYDGIRVIDDIYSGSGKTSEVMLKKDIATKNIIKSQPLQEGGKKLSTKAIRETEIKKGDIEFQKEIEKNISAEKDLDAKIAMKQEQAMTIQKGEQVTKERIAEDLRQQIAEKPELLKPEPKKGILQIAREEKLAKDASLRKGQLIPETVRPKKAQTNQNAIPSNQGILAKGKQIKNNIVESSLPISKQKAPDLSTLKAKQSYKASTWDKFRTFVQDSWHRAKKLEKTGVKNKTLQASEAQELYSGRVGSRLEDLTTKIKNIDADIVKTNKLFKKTDLKKQVNEFLQATHAPERNAIHGDGAAGMTNAEAKNILSEINSSASSKEVKRIAGNIKNLNNQTLDILKNGGIIDDATYSKLKASYKDYVPLNRIMPEDDDIIQALTGGKGLNVIGSGLKRAKGSEREIADILTNTYANLGEAITRAEKNRVNLATLEFARNNKVTGLFEEIKPKALGMSFDGKTPVLEKITDPMVLKIRENGKQIYLKIHDEGLAKMYQAIGQEKLPKALHSVEAITRFYASLATRFNPEFVLSNKIRDLQEAMVNVSAKKGVGFGGALKSGARDLASMKSVTEAMTGVKSEGAKLYHQMRLDGGTTGGMALSTRKNLEIDINAIEKLNRSNPRKAAEKIINGIENWNTIFEDSTRLSVYKTALDKGMTRDQAALLAKNATLNFNKKGTAGPIINSLYMFSNASIQGATNTLRAMKNPKVAATVTSLVGTATWTANSWNDKVDPQWRDKVSEWDRNSNLVVMIPSKEGSKYITIPVAWGIKPIKVMSDSFYDIANGKGKGIIKTAQNILVSAIDAYNPVGGTDLISTITPTVGDLPVDLARNKRWSGSLIKPDWMAGLPKADQYFDSLEKSKFGKALIGVTSKVSEMTGRKIDISPQDLEYAIDNIIGGGGRFIERSSETIAGIATGVGVESKNIPFWNRFVKSKTEEEVKSAVTRTSRSDVMDNLKQYKTGSEEQKNAIQKYLSDLPTNEDRQREAFILRDNGYDMKGIFTSKNVIKAREIVQLEPAERAKRLIEEIKKDPKFITQYRKALLEKDMSPEEIELKNSSVTDRVEMIKAQEEGMTKEAKDKHRLELIKKKIITRDVLTQLN